MMTAAARTPPRRGRGRRAFLVVLAVALVAAAAVTRLGGWAQEDDTPPLPATWYAHAENGGGSITLRRDHTGTFAGVPLGFGPDCRTRPPLRYSGEFTWKPVGNQGYLATFQGERFLFGPSSYLMGYTWEKVLVYTCEGQTDFGAPLSRYYGWIPDEHH